MNHHPFTAEAQHARTVTGGAGFISSNTLGAWWRRDTTPVIDDLSGGKRKSESAAEFRQMTSATRTPASRRVPPVGHPLRGAGGCGSAPTTGNDADERGGIHPCLAGLWTMAWRRWCSFQGATAGGPRPPLPIPTARVPLRPDKYCMELYGGLYQRLRPAPHRAATPCLRPPAEPHGEAGVCAILTQLMLDGKTPPSSARRARARPCMWGTSREPARTRTRRRQTINIASATNACRRPLRDPPAPRASAATHPEAAPRQTVRIVCTL